MDVTKFQLYPVHLALPCDTHSCRGKRAAFFLGKPQDPIGTITKICHDCAEELKVAVGGDEGLVESHQHLANQIDQLAEFILSNYPDEIGAGDPVNGESAVDVAIRLLQPKEEQQKPSIEELAERIPGTLQPEEPLPFEPDTVDILEIDGKLITEFTVRELKELCQEEKIEGYSNKDKKELIDLVTAHFEKSEE